MQKKDAKPPISLSLFWAGVEELKHLKKKSVWSFI